MSPMTMGLPVQSQDATRGDFNVTKSRIEKAFERLRHEMKEIQRQDLDLLTQLMHIRHTIRLLSQHGDRRSYSIDALDHSQVNNDVIKADLTSLANRRRTLVRVQSAPLETAVSEETILEEDEDCGEMDDDACELTQSLNTEDLSRRLAHERFLASNSNFRRGDVLSSDISSNHSHKCLQPDIVYALGPLPTVFKRLMTSSNVTSAVPNHRACADEPHDDGCAEMTAPAPRDQSSANQNAKIGGKRRKLQRQPTVGDIDKVGEHRRAVRTLQGDVVAMGTSATPRRSQSVRSERPEAAATIVMETLHRSLSLNPAPHQGVEV